MLLLSRRQFTFKMIHNKYKTNDIDFASALGDGQLNYCEHWAIGFINNRLCTSIGGWPGNRLTIDIPHTTRGTGCQNNAGHSISC